MSFEIQKNFFCENCINCGKRPVIEQHKKNWTIRCLAPQCKNAVTDSFINVEQWNKINKANIGGKIIPGNLKNSA